MEKHPQITELWHEKLLELSIQSRGTRIENLQIETVVSGLVKSTTLTVCHFLFRDVADPN